MTIEQFAQQIKTKYPQYSSVPDTELGNKMLEKYPQYKSLVSGNTPPQVADTFLQGHPILRAISDFVGTTGLAKGAAQGIFLNYTKEGKDALKMLSEGKITQQQFNDIVGGNLATNKEIVGSAIKTATSALAPTAVGRTAAARIGIGTATGAATGLGTALEQNKSAGETLKSTAIGGAIGLGVSGVLEGIGSVLGKISQSRTVQSRTGATYNKELQPPTKEVAKDIQNGFKTFGEQVANVTDEAGKPVYVGTYKQMLGIANEQLKTKGAQLEGIVKNQVPTVPLGRDDLATGLIQKMEADYGKLTPAQIKQIQFEVSRVPEEFTSHDLLGIKRMYDNLIPDSFWSKIGDPAQSFPSLVKYTLRDNARTLLNNIADNPIVTTLNNELGIAMDVRKLAASQLATRQLQKISGQGGYFYKLVGRFIDDYIFNPAITTRAAQGIRNLGVNTGQTVLRQATRTAITKGIVQNQPQ